MTNQPRDTITCKRCGREVDVTGQPPGRLVACGACRNFVQTPRDGDEAAKTSKLVEAEAPPPPRAIEPVMRVSPLSVEQAPRSTERAPEFDSNPFAAPQVADQVRRYPDARDDELVYRDGPPWESDGASVTSLLKTLLSAYQFGPGHLFRTMRRESRTYAPIWFIACSAALLGYAQFGIVAIFAWIDRPADGYDTAFLVGIGLSVLLMVPILFLVALFSVYFGSSMLHIGLKLVGGAKYPRVATARTLAYTLGATSWWQAIPVVGGLIGVVVMLVLLTYGLAKVHKVSVWRSGAAIILSQLLTCGLAAVLVYSILVLADAARWGVIRI